MNSEQLAIKHEPWAYLQLMRPANIITAWADILAGVAASGLIDWQGSLDDVLIPLIGLILATTGLYGGGIVFNDYFDANLDEKERPERPIPSRRASRQGAASLGIFLLFFGIFAAFWVSLTSGLIAIVVAMAALIYDMWGKHLSIIGPINMGLCRAGNLMLGVSILPVMLSERWFIGLFPLFYIGAITGISRGEVEGGDRRTGILALVLLTFVFIGILLIAGLLQGKLWVTLPFVLLLISRVVPAFVDATCDPRAEMIQKAVKSGIISLIIVNAAISASFTGLEYGLFVLALLPLSLGLGKLFAVT